MGFAAAETGTNGKKYFHNPYDEPTQDEKAKLIAAKKCINCRGMFKNCAPPRCPLSRADKKAWSAKHEPMRVTREMLEAAKPFMVASPAIEDTDPDQDDKKVAMPDVLGFPDEPPIAPGLSCGAMVFGEEKPLIQLPCIIPA